MKYGFPYMGSKSKIAEDIISVLPPAENLYDLFAGGGAITHCALLSGKWKNVIANDIQGTMQLFLDAVGGKYKNEKRWISREQFNAEKDNDPYIRWLWSFGNSGMSYLFGKDIENIKKEAHEFLFENGYDHTPKKRIELVKKFKEIAKKDGRFELEQLERLEQLQQLQQLQRLEQLQQLQQLERLEQLQQLERLEQLEQLQQLEVFSMDYREIEIKPKSVVYCDIPYNQKKGINKNYYGLSFDAGAFYEWAKMKDFPVYFSSSFCDDDSFEEVLSVRKRSLMSTGSRAGEGIIEKVYWNGVGEGPSDLFSHQVTHRELSTF